MEFFLLLSIESLKETKRGQENVTHHDKIGGEIRNQHVAMDEKMETTSQLGREDESDRQGGW